MKFEIASIKFKNAVDRVLAVVNTKLGGGLSCVKITADNNGVTISGTNIHDFADIEVDAVVKENGCTYVDASDIVKVYNLPGYITVEAANKIFSVRNDKKCCEVYAREYEDDTIPTKPTFDFDKDCRFKFTEKELLFVMENLNCFLSTSDTRPIMSGYNIDGKEGRIAACDQHRLGTRKLNATVYGDTSITIPGKTYKVLKKMGDAKSENEVGIYVNDDNNICFKGSDYVYITNFLDGDYLNVSAIMAEKTDFQFTVSAKELEKIAKEYMKAVTDKSMPMCFVKHNGKLSSAIVSSNYQTADVLQTVSGVEEIPDNFIIYMSPKFIAEAVKIFKDSDVTISVRKSLSRDESYYAAGMWFENDDFKCMVLPVRSSPAAAQNIRKIVDKI